MRALIQRVREARVEVDGRVTGAIGPGLLVLAGVAADDTDDDRDWLARKIVALRVFDDDEGVMNRSLADAAGDILAVSQFTLFASTRKGARPSWSGAAPPAIALPEWLQKLIGDFNPVVVAGVGGGVLLAVLGGGFFLWKRRKKKGSATVEAGKQLGSPGSDAEREMASRLAEQSAAQAVGGQGDFAHFDAGHAGDAVMFGEPLGEHGEARLHQRACGKVLGDQLAEEGGRLVGDALSE